jgi:hypothetical protein
MKTKSKPEVVASTVVAPSKAKTNTTKDKAKKAKAKDISNVIETVVKKDQKYLYRFQLEKDKLTPGKAKQRRQKIRRDLSNFDRDIRLEKNAEKKAEAIKSFLAFYKAEFILNDFTVASLSESREQHQIASYTEMLKLVQAGLAKK